jgi:class 3 adenylate cyclase/tetratricopeptide (TPR) repeat protein
MPACERCQHTNPSGAKFCGECGARVGSLCPACRHPNPRENRFCHECGAALGGSGPTAATAEAYTPTHLAEKILTSKRSLEGERKQVTILFSDLKGSTELLADRDPEDARAILDPVLHLMMDAVHHYEGTVNQVMGDGIMALFGAPVAHEDHGVRAAYAALRMQESVKRYAESVQRSAGVPIHIRVGLNSGQVVVRSIGSDLKMDYTAVGQTTHLAARMEQMAMPGSILMTENTLKLAGELVETRPLGKLQVKGFAEPVEAFELIGAGRVRTRFQAASERGLSPFVGREAERAAVREAAARARAGHGQVVLLVGDAGVGKSRLFWEIAHVMQAEGWRLLESRSLSYGRATPYLSVIELLRSDFQVETGDEERKIQEKITGRLLAVDETLLGELPVFLTLFDVPVADPAWQALDAPRRRQRTLDALTRLLRCLSEREPLLLVFEDLQWIDAESQAVLDAFVDEVAARRVLLLLDYRPEYTHAWQGRPHLLEIRVGALPAAGAGALLDALLGAEDRLAPLKRLLVERTQGNPFFLEESVRALAESGVLAGERGAYRLAKTLPGVQVPATVQAVLAARIDRLAPEDKDLLQSAAVVGKDIAGPLLQAVVEMPEPELRRGLTHLEQADFLYEVSLFPELQYGFRHTLTHDVAHGGLLQERRRALHGRVVDAIERLYAERAGEHVEALAHHAFRGERWDKAVIHLRRAAAKAIARAANLDAVSCLRDALTALARLPETHATLETAIDIRLELRPPLLQLGRLQEILTVSQDAEALALRLGDEPRLARVYTYLINYHYLKGEPEAAVDYGERCLKMDPEQNRAVHQLARRYLGHSYHVQGRYRRAEFILRENIEALDDARGVAPPEDVVSYVASAAWAAFTLAELGEFDLALAYADKAGRVAEASRHAYSEAIARTFAGFVWLRRGHLDRARPPLEESLAACRDKQLTVWQPVSSSMLGLALVQLGRVREGLARLEDGVTLTRELGVKAYLALWNAHLAEGLLAAGELERAQAVAQEALDDALAHGERGHEAHALRLLGEVALAQEPLALDKAELSLRHALGIAEELSMRPLLSLCYLGLGRVAARGGNRARAEEHLRIAIALFRAMETGLWLERAESVLRALLEAPAAVKPDTRGRVLFVVARDEPLLYSQLVRAFAGQANVSVLLDHRVTERRAGEAPPGQERRDGDRRGRPHTDAQIRALGWSIVRFDD